MSAAERLVAERGFRGVNASEVVRAAGQKNNSAVAYHFGSWDGLLEAVWTRHTVGINQRRVELLTAARSEGPIPLATLVSIYIDPLASELARSAPSYWARFNEQWLADAPLNVFDPQSPLPPADRPNPEVETVSVVADLLNQIIKRLKHLPVADRSRRVALMTRFVIGALAAWERDSQGDDRQDLDQLNQELLNLALALLLAPAAKRGRRQAGGSAIP
ncbi:MAG TPA: helix-turn-helix domain-containing protein [Frankiaceae bacterium]|nr:helix-turn-helix domain-containing protein [Frankiaceae bacterium]